MKLSKVTCEKCLQTGGMVVLTNVPNAKQINCQCNSCGRSRIYKVNKPIRDKHKRIVDFFVDISPLKTDVSGINPVRGPRNKDGKSVMNKKDPNVLNRMPSDSADEANHSRNERVDGMEKSYKRSSLEIEPHTKYFDVLAYKLDKDGVESDEPAIKGSDFVDSKDWNKRQPDPSEDAAPDNESIVPREERLNYRNHSKVIQPTAIVELDNLVEGIISSDSKEIDAVVENGHLRLGESYIPLGIFTDKGKTDLSENERKSFISESIQEDSGLFKESASQSVHMEPGCGQWCPKVRKAVPFYVCSHYCIDGRRVPQTDNELETYNSYLVKGGSDDGFVFCGYKDWLVREVDSYYPGWIEDHIEKMGGEVTKNQVPFQHKMNLDPGQRKQMPQYPDNKLMEKRMQEEGVHKYEHRMVGAVKIVDSNLKKTSIVKEDKKRISNLKKKD